MKNNRLTQVPSNYYRPAQHLIADLGTNYVELKEASRTGGILDRRVSKKTRRVFYRHKNLSLL